MKSSEYSEAPRYGKGCVFITAVPITKLLASGGRRTVEDMCYEIRRHPYPSPPQQQPPNPLTPLRGVTTANFKDGEGLDCQWGGEWRTCATRDYEPRPV